MKQTILLILLLLSPFTQYAQVELHPIYTSPHMGKGAKFSGDGSKIVTWGGYGFSVWETKSGKVLYTVTGHEGQVNYAEFNHAGTAIVTASDDNTAKIWNAETGIIMHILLGHKYWVCYAKFNATDDRIVTNSEDGNGLLWDSHNGRLIANVDGRGEYYIENICFNEKGNKIITTNSKGVVRIHDAVNGMQLFELEEKKGWFEYAVFNKRGNKVYVRIKDSLAVFTINTDFIKSTPSKIIDTTIKMKSKFYCCNCGRTHRYCFTNSTYINEDNTYVAYLKKWGKLEVYDIKTGEKVLQEIDTINGHKSCYFNKSGNILYSVGGKGIATAWSTVTWKKILQIGEANSYVKSITSDYSGNRIIVVGENTVTKIYNGKTGELERELQQNLSVKDEDFDDIHYCISDRTRTGGVAAISRITGKHLAEFTVKSTLPKWIHYYPNNRRYLLLYDSLMEIRNSETGDLITTVTNLQVNYYVTGFLQTGNVLSIGTHNGYELRSAITGNVLNSTKYNYEFFPLVTRLNTDSRLAFTDCKYNTLNIVNMISGRVVKVLEGHTGSIYSGILSKNENYVVTGSSDSTARVWNAKNGKTITVLSGHKGTTYAHFDSEANRVITASEDFTAKIWNTFSGELIATLTGHRGGVYDARFSKDGQTIITQSRDGVIRIYDANQLPYSFTDIPEEEKQTEITLSPNPVQNELNITFSEPIKEKGEYVILSPTGVQITKGIIEAHSIGMAYRVDKALSNGTYLCVLRSADKTWEEKFVVMR